MKEYRTLKYEKKKKNSFDEDFIKRYIKIALQGTVDTYLSSLHRGEISIAVKYLKDQKLFPIRAGEGADIRSNKPEDIDEAFTYRCLAGFGTPLRYIYIQNLEKLNREELKVVGVYEQQIRSRAGENYQTFIAVPIRGAEIEEDRFEVEVMRDLGLLGIDLERKFGFGNITNSEIYFLASLADLLSEPIVDLLLLRKQREAEQAVA